MSKRKVYLAVFLVYLNTINVVMADNVLVLGIVPQYGEARIRAVWNPVIRTLKNKSDINFKLRLAKSIPAFEQELFAGVYDCAYMNPYHLLVANYRSDYIPVVKDTIKKLQGVIVVAKESRINSIKELKGKVIAFPAPNALGAMMLFMADLREQYKFTIKPKYVKSHTSVYLNVALGQVTAGGGIQKTFDHQADNIRKKLKIIYTTKKVNAHPLACRSRLGQRFITKIRNAFIRLPENIPDAGLLKNFPMKKIGEANLHDYTELKRLLRNRKK